MSFEFEALVGYLYVVGGRTISATPPGALCEVAPKRAARGRELDTLFTLVLPSGDSGAPAKFYEEMARKATTRYFETSGSVTSGLRDVFNALNHEIYEINRDRTKPTHEANIILGVLRGKDLIIGRVGSAIVLLQHQGRVQTFPPDLNDDESIYIAPMGVHPVPNVRMTQYQVEAGTRVIFGDDNLADLVYDQMTNVMMSLDLGTVLVGFKELARLQLTILAIEFAPLESVNDVNIPTGQSTKEMAAQNRTRTRETGTTTAVASTNSTKEERQRKKRGKDFQRRAKREVGKAALGAGAGLGVINRMINHFFGEKEGKKSWFATPLGASSVILLPVAVVGLVVMLWLSGTGETEFEICLQEAQSSVQLAQSVANSDRRTIQDAWNLALNKIDECESLRPNDAELAGLRRQGQEAIDLLNDITRLPARVVASQERAELTDIVVQGSAMYVLDSNNNLVYRIDLAANGIDVDRSEAIQDMRQDGLAGGSIPIRGEIIGVDFNAFRNVFVAVSTDGVLVECQPNFAQNCTGQRLLGTENWVNPVAIKSWSGRIYVLDPGANQVWRYDPSGTASDLFLTAPIEYFGGSVSQPNLQSAVDFAISGGGVIYILLREGDIYPYVSGAADTFQYVNFMDGQQVDNAVAMFLDTRATAQDLYVVQQDRRAIYEMSYVGTYRTQYRTLNGSDFGLIADVAAAPSGDGQREILYVVSGNTVFALDKGQ